MTTLASAVSTPFTPSSTTTIFAVQITGGRARLQRRNTSGAAWADIPGIVDGAHVVTHVPGCSYQFLTIDGTPAVQADE